MAKEEKLDWIYKGANSLVNREEYLLGRKVDKTLDQINDDEKVKKIILPTPKNHVEHECIPPSIRDFNKIVQSEQVDLNAKLQEDPLVAIKKREEEARRQFLQNPIQIKKLQQALKKKEEEKRIKKTKKKRSKDDLDSKIKEKLKVLGIGMSSSSSSSSGSRKDSKKDKEDVINTILMHKFNALKDKLSDKDLNDILNGKVGTSSEDEEEEEQQKEKTRGYSSSSSDGERSKNNYKNMNNKDSKYPSEKYNRQRNSRQEYYRQKDARKGNNNNNTIRNRSRSRSRSEEHRKPKNSYRSNTERNRNRSPEFKKRQMKNEPVEDSLDSKIMSQLRILRKNAEESKKKIKTLLPEKPPHLKSSSHTNKSSSEDSENENATKKTFGLVNSAGKRIAFQNTDDDDDREKSVKSSCKKVVAEPVQLEFKQVKKMSEHEKEKLRREMMQDAKVRNQERELDLKNYRNKDKEEEEMISKKYDADLIHNRLMQSAKHTSIEERIKSKLNTIQRSSRCMDQNFSKRT